MAATIERLIASGPQGHLLAGLLWRAPSGGRSRARALQEAKALTAEASHYAAVQAGSHLRFGMYQARASEESLRLPKPTHSAAACFAHRVGAQAPNAALVLSVPAAGRRAEDKYFVVCLDDGVPVVDVLSNEVEARNALGAEDRPIWSDNPVAYPNCEVADFAWLAAGADKSTRLAPIPVNPWPLVAVAVVLLSAGGGWALVQRAQRAEEARRLAEEARAADPVPRYLLALRAQRPHMAADRAALVAAAESLFRLPAWVAGWQLAAAQCSAQAQACIHDWVRKGGTFDDLRQAVPTHTLELLPTPATQVPLFDRARTRLAWRIPRVELGAPGRALATLEQAFAAAGPQLQVWRTADLSLEFKKPVLWPRVPEVPAGFSHPAAVLAGEFELRDVPGPFILEALRSAPDFLSWESVRVDLGDGPDARAALKFQAAGVFYVAAK